MVDHDVYFKIPEKDLGKAGVEFRVRKNKRALGKLRISEGGALWIPANNTYGRRLAWSDFGKAFQEHGYAQKK